MTDHEPSRNITTLGDLLTEMSLIQLRYIAVRPHVNSNTAAAKAIGIARETAARWPNKAKVDAAVQLMAMDGVQVTGELLRRHLPQAAQEIINELGSRNVAVRHRAAVDILDRAMGKAIQRSEVSGPGGKPIETKDADSPEHNRAISSLAHAIGALIPGEGGTTDGPLDAAESEAVAGVPEPGG